MNEFKKMLLEKLPLYLEDNQKVKIETVQKVNRTEEALMLAPNGGKEPFVTPSCSISYLYDRYLGFESEEQFLKQVATIFKNNCENGVSLAHKLRSFSKEDVLNRVVPVLMPTDKNQSFLDTLVSRPFLDLTLVYNLILMEENGGTGSCIVTKHFAKAAHISEEELYQNAITNAKRNGYQFRNINDILKYHMDEMESDLVNFILGSHSPLSVLTNRSGIKGAGLICCPDILQDISSFYQGDFYIVPCSMHEIITLKKEDVDIKELKNIICVVNQTELQEVDVLSNSLYAYNSETKMIEIVE